MEKGGKKKETLRSVQRKKYFGGGAGGPTEGFGKSRSKPKERGIEKFLLPGQRREKGEGEKGPTPVAPHALGTKKGGKKCVFRGRDAEKKQTEETVKRNGVLGRNACMRRRGKGQQAGGRGPTKQATRGEAAKSSGIRSKDKFKSLKTRTDRKKWGTDASKKRGILSKGKYPKVFGSAQCERQ